MLIKVRTPPGRRGHRWGAPTNLFRMCRNIRTLYNFEPPATEEEVHDAALQYVRKISGFTKPSKANDEAFERAVDEVAAASGPRERRNGPGSASRRSRRRSRKADRRAACRSRR